MTWNPRLPAHWARLLGLAVAPLFGHERTIPEEGEHVVLLDGMASSLTLSLGAAEALLNSKLAAQWAWSSNVSHAAVIDQTSNRLFWVRSDKPFDINELPQTTPEGARNLLSIFADDVVKPSSTSIQLALDVFRSLRVQIHEDGGSDIDAIKAFNVLLLWADAIRLGDVSGTIGTSNLADAVGWCHTHSALVYSTSDFSQSAISFPLGQLAEQLLEERRGFPLDPYLLVRHASGTLFQETHVELGSPPTHQRRLFTSLYEKSLPPEGASAKDTRYTPTSLARFLTEAAVRRFLELNEPVSAIEILDPACGSGVFLIESCRALAGNRTVRLRGYDKSDASVLIARFAVEHAARSAIAEGNSIQVDVTSADSLSSNSSWGSPDIILMNPPFLSWRMISQDERDQVRTSLGDLYVGQSDTAIAFVAKAAASLKPGSVLATLVPGSFLNSRAASPLRKMLADDSDLSIELIGLFRGFTFFMEAAVEPAFLIIARTIQTPDIPVILAESGVEDHAIRGARTWEPPEPAFEDGYEITLRSPDMLHQADWTPRPLRGTQTVSHWLSEGNMPRLSDLFELRLGVRPGAKRTLMVASEEVASNASPHEQSYFRPVADLIRNAHIIPGNFLFYPYREGKLSLVNEEQLNAAVPWFYQNKLLPNKDALASRKSLRDKEWWELVEPRLTWMDRGAPRIITPSFGYSGSFAFDTVGEYVIVQGSAWFWRQNEHDEEILLAYLALFNSYEFESLLELFCPKVAGGQYQLYERDLASLPVPDLTQGMKSVREKLIEVGRSIEAGDGFDPMIAGDAVCEAYGSSADEFRHTFARGERGELQEVFDGLVNEWKRESRHISKVSSMERLASYQKIIDLGEKAVPLLLRELDRRPDFWFSALCELTKANPVPREHCGHLQQMAEDWIKWAREHRQW